MKRRAAKFALVGVLASLAVFAVACGGSSSGAGSGDSKDAPPALVVVRAKNLVFDTKTIALPANTDVTVRFVNDDPGVPHNVAFYTKSDAREKIFVQELFNGVKTEDAKFRTPGPGTYYFRCDSHPEMAGTLEVK